MSLVLDDVLKKLDGVTRSGKGWLAYCPAHDDKGHKSLSITRSEKNSSHAAVHCFSGCKYQDIVSALDNGHSPSVRVRTVEQPHTNGNGATKATLRETTRLKIPGPTPLEWLSEYTSLDPAFLETQDIDFSKPSKIGYQFKGSNAIKWRPYSKGAPKGLWELQGDDPPPLWPTLPDSLEDAVVFISAGETDCLCLRACEVDAFALTRGEAAALSKSLFKELKKLGTAEIVYVPDADEAGHRAISRVRRSAESAGLSFRVLDLEAHLKASRGEKDLRSLVRRIGLEDVRTALEAEYIKGPASVLESIDLTLTEKPIPWVVNPMFARGTVTLFSGQAKSGKTTFMFKLMDQMRTGGLCVDFHVTKARIVYFTENNRLVISQKAKQILTGSSSHIKVVYRDNDELEGKTFDEAVALIFDNAKRFNADLLVVDTLAGLSVMEDENDAAGVSKALKPFRVAADRNNVAVALVHHLGKSGTERGSSVLLSEPDILIRIEGDGPEKMRVIKMKNNLVLNQPDDVYFTMDEEGHYQVGLNISDFDSLVMQSLPHKVDEAITLRELAEKLELAWDRKSKDRLAHVLEKLQDMGKVARNTPFEGIGATYRYYRVIGVTAVSR